MKNDMGYRELEEKLKTNNPEFTAEELRVLQIAVKFLKNASYEHINIPFICGEAGEKDNMGMPDYFLICPLYGVDSNLVYSYKKHRSPGDKPL